MYTKLLNYLNTRFYLSHRLLLRILTLLFFISIIPLYILAPYNFPSCDDFFMVRLAHEGWINTGSIVGILDGALQNVRYNYLEWSGLFSSVFITSLQPMLYDERLYYITSYVTISALCLSVSYFFHSIFTLLASSKVIYRSLNILVLIIIVQFLPNGNEAFYWHPGCISYTLAQSLLLILIGLIINVISKPHSKINNIRLILSSILSIIICSSNYMTGLLCIVLFMLTISLLIIYKKLHNNLILLTPILFGIISFTIAIMAPGNSIRQSGTQGFSIIYSIILSFYYSLNYAINNLLTWQIIIILIICVPIIFEAISDTQFTFPYPLIIIAISFCLLSVTITPTLYGSGNFSAYRLQNTIFITFIILLFIDITYIIGWINSRYIKHPINACNANFTTVSSITIISLGVFLTCAMVMNIKIDPDMCVSSSALKTLISGEARKYKEDNIERYNLIHNNNANSILVPKYRVQPKLLYITDITSDPEYWINKGIARYYGLNSISLIE